MARKVHADQAAGGDRQVTAGEFRLDTTPRPDYFARTSKRAGPDGAHPQRHFERGARRRNRVAQPCWMFSVLGMYDVFKPIGAVERGERKPLRAARMLLHLRTFCCSTSPRTISTCARRTFCWRRWKFSGTVVFVSHDATSSTSWRRASLKWRMARCTCSRKL